MKNKYLLTFTLLLLPFTTDCMLKNLVKRPDRLLAQTLRRYSNKRHDDDHDITAKIFAGSGLFIFGSIMSSMVMKNNNDNQLIQSSIKSNESKQVIIVDTKFDCGAPRC